MCGEDSKIAAVCAATPKKKMCISSLRRSPYNYNPQNEMLGDLETKRSKPKTKRTSWGTPLFLKKVGHSLGGMV